MNYSINTNNHIIHKESTESMLCADCSRWTKDASKHINHTLYINCIECGYMVLKDALYWHLDSNHEYLGKF